MLLGILLASLLLFALPGTAAAQSYFDVSPCFNDLLQQKFDYTSTEKLALATLSQVSQSTYEQFKHDGKLSVMYSFLPLSASYADFDEKRSNYFSLRKLDINYYRAISISSRTLGDAGYAVITNCISQLASKADGFHYLYTVDDPRAASVQFFWRPPVNAATINQVKVTDSTLVNAFVVNGESYKGHLYDHGFFRFDPKIGVASPVILLNREDLDSVIRISLVTEPQLNTGFITIPPVPKPLPAPEIVTSFVDTNWPFEFDKLDPANKLVGGGTPDCNDCREFERVVDLPGEVVSVRCTMGPGSHNNTAFCGKIGENQAKWKFYTNDGNHQSMTFNVIYKKKVETCVKNCVLAG
jgi:hypothetical protein